MIGMTSTCNICMEEFDLDDQHMTYLEDCNHFFCKSCLMLYVNNAVNTNKFPIVCPDPNCKCTMNQGDIESVLVNKKDLEKFRN